MCYQPHSAEAMRLYHSGPILFSVYILFRQGCLGDTRLFLHSYFSRIKVQRRLETEQEQKADH